MVCSFDVSTQKTSPPWKKPKAENIVLAGTTIQ